jgi:hypothetical protein
MTRSKSNRAVALHITFSPFTFKVRK